ncbi:MAG: MmgE/PrpD family protein [Pseudomonadota bacterium]
MTAIQTFAAFTTRMSPPDAARIAARRCMMDTLGAIVAGGTEMPAVGLARTLPDRGPVRLVPRGRSDMRTAALINATAAHTVEVDDIFRDGLYHPGVAVIPAALAVAEAETADGPRLIDAIIAAYEVSNRIARAVNPAHYNYWHTTATVGHFGAAVAAGHILRLSTTEMAHAMGTVATMAAGLRHAFSAGSMTKPLHAGRAAEAGVLAALTARAGITGVADMLDGARGFGQAMSEDVDWVGAVADLGEVWTITQMTQKAHACCGHNFAALDAIRILMAEHDLTAPDISAIEVGGYRATVEICGEAYPTTPEGARFSLPYCAAVMALRGTVTPEAFSTAALHDRGVRNLAARVTVAEDAEAEAGFPQRRSALVTLVLADGRQVSHRRLTRKGDPDDPLTDDELALKFRDLVAPVLGRVGAGALARAIHHIEQMDDVRGLPLQVTQGVQAAE